MADIHSGINISNNTLAVVNEYGIRDKVGYFVLDNVKTNDVAVRLLAKELGFHPTWRRGRCAGHIIALVASATQLGIDYEMFDRQLQACESIEEQVELWRSKGPIGKLWSTVKWILASPGRVQRFRKVQLDLWQEQEGRGSAKKPLLLNLMLDNQTR
jgi:hypothetical protein